MITVDWTMLAKVVTVLGLCGGAFVAFIKIIVFFNNLSNAVKTLTAMAVRLEVSAQSVAGVVTDLNVRVEKVELILDMDDRAQAVVRDRVNRRERLRRDQDRVAMEVRDIMHNSKDIDPNA